MAKKTDDLIKDLQSSMVEEVDIELLIPYARNARTHDDAQVAQIAASITEFGWMSHPIIDEKNMIIAGHGRVMAARKLGLAKVPCIRKTHLTDTQKKAYIIADNQLALNAGWNVDMLHVEIVGLRDDEFNLDLLGFSEKDLSRLLEPPAGQGLVDDDYVPKPPAESVSQRGDIWLLGESRVMCGDSTSFMDVELLMAGRKADMVFTDPPYGVSLGHGETVEQAKARNRRTDGKIVQNDELTGEKLQEFLFNVFRSMLAVSKPGGAIYVCHADSEGHTFRRALIDSGWLLKQNIVWVKDRFVMSRQDYHWRHEPILYGWGPGAAHGWYGDRKQDTVWEIARPGKSEDHPTMKPVELVERGIKNSSKAGDIVLDLFGGSGTTLIAAVKNERVGHLMELDGRFVDVIVKRWEEWTGKDAVREQDGVRYKDAKEELDAGVS